MQSLLRATSQELPDRLRALALTETPVISDDPDPDIGLSWRLPTTGMEVSFDEGRVSTIFLYGKERDGFSIFAGQLPLDLIWDKSFQTVLRDHSDASRLSHGSDSGTTPLGPVPPWIRYDTEAYCTHIQFCLDESRIDMVTIMTPERAP
jgi:hypothetical protein